MKRITTVIALAASALLASCNADKSTPGYTYMDDMYVSPSLETYQPSTQFANGLSAQLPVEGTVPRGYHPYEYANTNEDMKQQELVWKCRLNSCQKRRWLKEKSFTIFSVITVMVRKETVTVV